MGKMGVPEFNLHPVKRARMLCTGRFILVESVRTIFSNHRVKIKYNVLPEHDNDSWRFVEGSKVQPIWKLRYPKPWHNYGSFSKFGFRGPNAWARPWILPVYNRLLASHWPIYNCNPWDNGPKNRPRRGSQVPRRIRKGAQSWPQGEAKGPKVTPVSSAFWGQNVEFTSTGYDGFGTTLRGGIFSWKSFWIPGRWKNIAYNITCLREWIQSTS